MTQRHERFAWAKLNAYGILLAGLALLGISDLIDPGGANLARLVGEVPSGQPIWVGGLVVSGVLLLAGFVRTDRLSETLGLLLLTASLVAQTTAAWSYLGWAGFTLTRVAILALVVACTWARISVLWSKRGVTVTIPPRGEKPGRRS